MKQSSILIVDDEPVNVILLQEILNKAGYLVLTASSGTESLQVMEQIRPDLVFMDIMMPDMNGIEVLGRIKDDPATQNIPVIMITASRNDIYREESIKKGASAYIVKPISNKIILDTVENILKTS